VGEGARATNYDYTKGKLDALVDVVIESGAKLFVSAVGVPTQASEAKLCVCAVHAARYLCITPSPYCDLCVTPSPVSLPSYHSYQATIAKLHAADILVMNMVGAPKHVSKVREVSK